MAGPDVAGAAVESPCERLADRVQRSQCELRESSRERAEREAAERANFGVDPEAAAKDDDPAAGDDLGRRWQEAVEDARSPDIGALVFSREGGLVIGLVWLMLALGRERKRLRARKRRPG